MFEKLKEFSGLAFGFVVMIGIFAVPVVFIMGSVWAAEHLFEPLIVIGWVAIAIDVVLLALSVFKGIRALLVEPFSCHRSSSVSLLGCSDLS